MGTALFALRFRYPVAPSKDAPVATPRPFSSGGAAPVAAEPVELAVPVRAVNADYWYCGSPWLRPAAASERFVLRRGQLVGCVENRGYAGSGAWVANGAFDAAQTREMRR